MDWGTTVPPVNVTLTRVVVLMRLLCGAWFIALIGTASKNADANQVLLAGAALTATTGAAVTLLAVKRGFVGDVW